MRRIFRGGCHCGAIRLAFATDAEPAKMEVRACQCDFCRRQGSEAVSDPRGSLEIGCAQPAALRHYRFAHGKADYLSCANCGIYLGAVTQTQEGLRGFTLIRVLDERDRFTGKRVTADFEGEGAEARQARRMARWTPTALLLGQGG